MRTWHALGSLVVELLLPCQRLYHQRLSLQREIGHAGRREPDGGVSGVSVSPTARSEQLAGIVAPRAEIAVAVVGDACLEVPIQATHGAVEVTQDAEGGLLWVQASWTGRSPSPS